MGLDISAYTKLTPVPAAQVERDEHGAPTEDFLTFHSVGFTEKHFPGRTAGLTANAFYRAEHCIGFRAGSYSGYSEWRNWLARVAGYPSAEAVWNSTEGAGPFFELINFSDCEGVIGPVVAAKLAKDFAEHEQKAEDTPPPVDDSYFLHKYREWKRAFEMAADNGAVEFH